MNVFFSFLIFAVSSTVTSYQPAANKTTETAGVEVQKAKVVRVDHYLGTINNKYKISMVVEFTDGVVDGTYKYVTQKSGLILNGTFDAGTKEFKIQERSQGSTTATGFFEGKMEGDVLTGTWYDGKRTKSFPFSVTKQSKTIPEFSFMLEFEKDDGYDISKINVLDAKGTKLQELGDFESFVPEHIGLTLTLQDINFDGYPDLSLFQDQGAGANVMYNYWLYHPETKLFGRVMDFELWAFDTIDYVNQTLSLENYSAGKSELMVFRFSGGHFVQQ